MTRFCWWTLTWFGMGAIYRAITLHYMGWPAFAQAYDLGIRAGSDMIGFILWIMLWHLIVKHEGESSND